ncbi:hypothetical protein RWE15_12175 [Virgibacillus halophilus]|uniref:Uncharacterized protein n=1 Tax=Tigheibacillus halophilus TaxID=361280 RepID=A0ABU5C6S5_9BACI|nr:hypothetical protein [Virgibacillus halophilus]
MNYFNDDQSFSAYRQQGSWVCFPVQEGSQNQGGLEGQINMSDGSQQPVVCYPSQPQAEGQGQGGNSQGQSGGQEQQGGGENEGQQQGGQDQEGMPTPPGYSWPIWSRRK